MKSYLGFFRLLSVVLLGLLTITPFAQLPIVAQDQNEPGQGNLHRDDPCDHLPIPPGEAKGIDKRCPPTGSSSGIAKPSGGGVTAAFSQVWTQSSSDVPGSPESGDHFGATLY